MYDYSTLIGDVRRVVNDLGDTTVEITPSTSTASYYVQLRNEGDIHIPTDGFAIDNVPVSPSGYELIGNIIKNDTLIPQGSVVSAEYTYYAYSDELIIEFIGDAVHNLVEAIFTYDFEFGEFPSTGGVFPSDVVPSGVSYNEETWTEQDIDQNLEALFVYGAAMNLMVGKIVEAGDDAIYIKDGDTVIDTAKSSKEKSRGYEVIYKKWEELLEIVRINRFSGVTMY